MNSKVSHIVETWKKLSKIPALSSATLLPGLHDDSLCIHSVWESQDLIKFEKTAFARHYVLERPSFNVLSAGIGTDIGSVHLHAFSRLGKQAIVREKKSTDEKMYLEIWNSTQKEITFDMTDRKEHGKIVASGTFGSFEWSSDEKYLLYIAEGKQPKSVSYFKDSTETKEGNEDAVKGEEYVYKECWGERLVGIHHTVLCILEVETGNIQVFKSDEIGTELSIGPAIWGPNDESVVFVGWEELPYRLGIWACMNRRSDIYSVNLKTKEIGCISNSGNMCARSPRFSPCFDTLLYLECEAGKAHNKCSKLQKCDWKTKKISTLVDVVQDPTGDEFPGIYADNLVSRCWSEDGKHIFLSSLWRSYLVIIRVNVNNGSIQKIKIGDEFGVSSLLDVYKNVIIATVSAPNLEPCLVLNCLNEEGNFSTKWKILDANTPVKHSGVKWSVHTLVPSINKNNLDFEIIVMGPTEKKGKCPLVMIPHGGPHSTFPPGFSRHFGIGFIKLGYVVCFVNFRGSLGFGERNVNSLPGNIGEQDVADVVQSTLYVKNNCGLDIGDIFYVSGSHGGFLGAHISGQYPDLYKAVVLRNPVIDLNSMNTTTDIPDWCWVEGGCGDHLKPTVAVRPEQQKLMWEKSPIQHAEKVCTPTLLLLGSKDIRVPFSQGIMYYHLLKARNVPAKVYMYEDNHGLVKTQHEGDAFVQTALWFKEYSSSS